jgi:hypothetical protein
MKLALVVACSIVFSANAFGNCATNGRGETACGNGQSAAGYNANTGNAWKSQTNANGVRTTQTSRGGEAKTVNGKGVYKAPNGQTCYKTASSRGCN